MSLFLVPLNTLFSFILPMCNPLMKPLLKLVNNPLATTAPKYRSASTAQYLKKVNRSDTACLCCDSSNYMLHRSSLSFLCNPAVTFMLPHFPSSRTFFNVSASLHSAGQCYFFSTTCPRSLVHELMSISEVPAFVPLHRGLLHKPLGSWSLLTLHLKQTITHS